MPQTAAERQTSYWYQWVTHAVFMFNYTYVLMLRQRIKKHSQNKSQKEYPFHILYIIVMWCLNLLGTFQMI